MTAIGIDEAKANFSNLIERVESGQKIVIQRGGRPVAMIVPHVAPTSHRQAGALKGQIWIADDFGDIPPRFDEYLV